MCIVAFSDMRYSPHGSPPGHRTGGNPHSAGSKIAKPTVNVYHAKNSHTMHPVLEAQASSTHHGKTTSAGKMAKNGVYSCYFKKNFITLPALFLT
jgi:hypothetical protein